MTAPSPEPSKVEIDGDDPLSLRAAARKRSDALAEQRRERLAQLSEVVGEDIAAAEEPGEKTSNEEVSSSETVETAETSAPSSAESAPADPLAEERQRLAAERTELAQLRQASAAEIVLSAQVQAAATEFNRRYGDLPNLEAMQRLQYQNPQRFAELQRDLGALLGAVKQGQQLAQHRQAVEGQISQRQQAEQAKERETFIAEQDAIVEKAVPELKNPAVKRALGEAARDMLLEVGVGEQELRSLWSGEAKIDIRSAAAQRVLLDAAKWRQAQAKAKEVTAQPKPPVQRPGAARPHSNGAEAKVAAAEKDFATFNSGSKGLRAAADLVKARREARRA